jgi:hypothetical protein
MVILLPHIIVHHDICDEQKVPTSDATFCVSHCSLGCPKIPTNVVVGSNKGKEYREANTISHTMLQRESR